MLRDGEEMDEMNYLMQLFVRIIRSSAPALEQVARVPAKHVVILHHRTISTMVRRHLKNSRLI